MNRAGHFTRRLSVWIVFLACCLRSGLLLAQDDMLESLFEVDPSKSLIYSVDKSENDARSYRYLVLENGLRVLLISDPTSEKSAAAMDVHAGHNQDPQNRAGLAHLIEHSLPLNSEKYPKAGEFQAYVNQHGGSHNAYTLAEHTNYFFDVDSARFESALDRFAQFFTAPLFNPERVERAKKIIHAEYLGHITDDSKRIADVYREVLNPAHPSARFSFGNQETLTYHEPIDQESTEPELAEREEKSVRDDLIAFYQRYYSAKNMTLVVLGKEPLKKLQTMVEEQFKKIPASSVTITNDYPPLFPADYLPATIQIKPEKELRQLSLLFPIPDYRYDYHKKPWKYVSHLLGHEGKGSVLSLLKNLGWAEGLSAGIGAETRDDALFQLTVDLTEKGVRAKDQIVPLLFYMIEQLQAKGLKEWRYEELQKLAELELKFQEKKSSLETVSQLAPVMHFYMPRETITGDYLYTAYDEKLIRECLKNLHLKNVAVVLVAPEIETDKVSTYFNAPYSARKTPLEAYEIKPSVRKKLAFPEPNVFIPKRLTVKSRLILPTPSQNAPVEMTGIPQLIVNNERTRVWFSQDHEFHSPKSVIQLRLLLPRVAANAEGAAQAQLFAALVMDELNEFSYPANLAGLNYAVRATAQGLDISISGYSGRQGLLLSKIATAIRKGRFDQQRFNNVKKALIRDLHNDNLSAPYVILARQISILNYQLSWTNADLIQVLNNKTLDQFHKFSTRMLRDAKMDALLNGNLFRQEAIKLASLAEYEFLGETSGAQSPVTTVYQLKSFDNKPWLYRYPIAQQDYLIQLYVQSPKPDIVDTAHMKFLQHILLPAFVDDMRTEKELGHMASVFSLPLRNLEGSVFVIQSSTVTEPELIKEIDRFLLKFNDVVTDNFEDNKSALLRQFNEPALSIIEQSERYWDSILLDDRVFGRRAQLANALAGITKESLRAYYKNVFLDESKRLWLSSQKTPDDESMNVVNDIDAYRQQQKSLVYP